MTIALVDVVLAGDYLVLDTETTGLGPDAEICQIAVIDSAGRTLLNTLVSPQREIPADATRIHGITNDMVLSAPNWRMVCQRLANALNGKHVVIYNADYDVRLLYQSTSAAGLRMDWRQVARFWCAMLPFSEIYGDWNDYHQSYTWQKLETAARYYGIEVADAHSALGDCLMTLAVVQAMAQHERGG